MYSYGLPHMAVQKQDDQHEHTFSSYVRIRDVVLKTYLGRWTIGRSGERGSGISVQLARHDDDDIHECVSERDIWWESFYPKDLMSDREKAKQIDRHMLIDYFTGLCTCIYIHIYIYIYHYQVMLIAESSITLSHSIFYCSNQVL